MMSRGNSSNGANDSQKKVRVSKLLSSKQLDALTGRHHQIQN